MGSERDRPVIEITPALIDAGVKSFEEWFDLSEHQEGLLELPSKASIAALASASFLAMMAVMPDSR